MASSDVSTVFETYNYESFSRSESAGKSSEFKTSLRAGEEAPDFELPTLQVEIPRRLPPPWHRPSYPGFPRQIVSLLQVLAPLVQPEVRQ